jgi:hypothetical protein
MDFFYRYKTKTNIVVSIRTKINSFLNVTDVRGSTILENICYKAIVKVIIYFFKKI